MWDRCYCVVWLYKIAHNRDSCVISVISIFLLLFHSIEVFMRNFSKIFHEALFIYFPLQRKYIIRTGLDCNSTEYYVSWEYQHSLSPKNCGREYVILTNILTFTKSSCKIFMPKCPHIPIIYITYKKNQHILVWGYWQISSNGTVWAKKITQKKSSIFIKIFELYQLFIQIFLCQTVPNFPFYILLFKHYSNYLLLE